MTIFEMLGQSGVLALLGMGVVFLFLFILVIVVSRVGKIIQAAEAAKNANRPAAGETANPKTPQITAAIIAAVNEYRKNN